MTENKRRKKQKQKA